MGHGVRKPDYEAADKSQRLLLAVPAPALRHSFAQHLIRGEKIMDPDAGVRNRVKMVRLSLILHSTKSYSMGSASSFVPAMI